MSYDSKQYLYEINKLRYNGMVYDAIDKCHDAIAAYPEDNFFYKVLGDLYIQDEDYNNAANAYLEQLKRLDKKPEHFKAFARFYRLLSLKVSKEFLDQYKCKILDAVREGEVSQVIHQQLIDTFGDVFIIDDGLRELLRKSDDDKYLNDIKHSVDLAPDDVVRAIISYQISGSSNPKNALVKEFLVSTAEKKELYSEALQLIGKMLAVQQRPNPTTIRTLLRISRKQQDYSYAESILNIDETLLEKSDFNIQYELVYYFDSIHDSALLDKTLKRMRGSASGSIPIARTLYNFYLTFDRFEEAQAISEHIQKLTADIRNQKHEPQKSKLQERNEAQLESGQFVWQKIKDLVSEKEHNRQMLALRELLKGFSHELGQPITNIRYKVQLQQMRIQRGIGTPDEIDNLLIAILEQTARIGTLLDRFRPIVSSKSTQTTFSVNVCINQVFTDLNDRLNRSNITYRFVELSDSHLFGDQIQFSQVFYNLVLNSMQAIEENGNIQVQLSEAKNEMKIIFTDDGPGIPKENSKKIFEPFFSTKDPTAGNGGEGLGLFIVWNILRMYKGTIRVNYKYKKGAQFIIKIPIEEE